MKRIWFGLIVSAVALWLVFRSVDAEAALETLQSVAILPLLAALALVVVQVLLVSWRWAILLPTRPGGERVGIQRTVSPVFIGYLGNLVLPARLGDAARAYIVARRESLGLSQTIGSVILERLTDTATGALVALVIAIELGAPAWVVQLSAVATAAALALVLVLTFSGLDAPLAWLERRMHRFEHPAVQRSFVVAGDFVTGMRIHDRRPAVAGAAGMSFANWLLEGLIYWLVASSLGLGLSPAAALLIAAVTVLATAIPSAPGYLGTFELAAVAVTVAMGVPSSAALAYAVLVHAATILPLAVGGLIAIIPMGLTFRPLREAALAAERAAVARGAGAPGITVE